MNRTMKSVTGMPVHDDLHVWAWAHNPASMFAEWNPALSCNLKGQ